uniref:Uncharacterized protein n=1 Tax=Anguilla anguilla TaxID=7936 RepID=A0A0E9QLV3_ANGAN
MDGAITLFLKAPPKFGRVQVALTTSQWGELHLRLPGMTLWVCPPKTNQPLLS